MFLFRPAEQLHCAQAASGSLCDFLERHMSRPSCNLMSATPAISQLRAASRAQSMKGAVVRE